MLNHKKCWSQLLSEYRDIYGSLLWQETVNNQIVATVALYSTEKNTNWEKFFISLKEKTAVRRIEHIESYQKANIFIVKFVNNANNSVTSVIKKYDVPFHRGVFYGGLEIWDLFVWHEYDKVFVHDVKERAEIVNFTELDGINFPDPFIEKRFVSDVQLLKFALKNGYYSENKRINLAEIAKLFATSKSNLSRKFKKFETYVINYYIANHFHYTDLDKYLVPKNSKQVE
ncbi:MAG: helix-turn-helix domain-containing protein [Thermoplasmatales archaeon]